MANNFGMDNVTIIEKRATPGAIMHLHPLVKDLDYKKSDIQYTAATISKFGGIYYWNKKEETPSIKGKPVNLLVQINSDDIKSIRFKEAFSKLGLLQIFCKDFNSIKQGNLSKSNIIVKHHKEISKKNFMGYGEMEAMHLEQPEKMPFNISNAISFTSDATAIPNSLEEFKRQEKLKKEKPVLYSKVGGDFDNTTSALDLGKKIRNTKYHTNEYINLVSIHIEDFKQINKSFKNSAKMMHILIREADLSNLNFDDIVVIFN